MRAVAMVAMGLMVLTGLGGMLAGWAAPSRPAWFLIAFEALTALTGAMGLVWSRSEGLRQSSLMLVCVGGVCVLMSLLGYLSVKGQLAGYGLKPWVALRGLIALALGAAAVTTALNGYRDLWRMVARGTLAAGVLVIGAGAIYRFRGVLGGMDGLVRFALAIVALSVAGVLVCYAGHVVIRAFQIAEERRSAGKSA